MCFPPLSPFRASHSAAPATAFARHSTAGRQWIIVQFLQVNLNLSSSRHSLGQAVSGFSLLVDLNTLREKAEPKQSEPDPHTCHQTIQGDLMSRKLLHPFVHNERALNSTRHYVHISNSASLSYLFTLEIQQLQLVER